MALGSLGPGPPVVFADKTSVVFAGGRSVVCSHKKSVVSADNKPVVCQDIPMVWSGKFGPGRDIPEPREKAPVGNKSAGRKSKLRARVGQIWTGQNIDRPPQKSIGREYPSLARICPTWLRWPNNFQLFLFKVSLLKSWPSATLKGK